MPCTYSYKNKEYTEQELKQVWITEQKMFSIGEESEPTESELEIKLKSFLNQFGIEASRIDAYKERLGKNGQEFTVRGFADMLNKVVKYDESSLPEETSHIAVELFVEPSSTILEQVTQTDLYKEKHKEYKSIYGNETQVRKEILGKLVAQQIIHKNNEGIDGRLRLRIQRLWDKFVSWIKGNKELRDYIEGLASKVIKNDIEGANISRLGDETYYSVLKTFKEVEESTLSPQEKLLNKAIISLKQRLQKLKEKKVAAKTRVTLDDQITKLEIELEAAQAELGIDLMIKYFNEDSQTALNYINSVKAGNVELDAKELGQLKEFLDYYYPILTDLRQSINRGVLTDNGRYKLIKEELARFDEIYDYYKDVYKDEAAKFLGTQVGETTSTDMNMAEYLFGSLRDVGDDIARRVHFEISKILTNTRNIVYDIGKDLIQYVQDRGTLDTVKFRERDSKGKKTHYFVSPYKLSEFYTEYETFLEALKKEFGVDSYPKGLKERTEWNKRINAWKEINEERQFVPEYYNLFNSLSYDARLAQEQYNVQIKSLLLSVTDKDNNVHFDKLSDTDYALLEELEAGRKGLSNLYYSDGTKKQGTDLDIATELKALYEKLKGKLDSPQFSTKFTTLAGIKKRDLSQAEYDKWFNRVTQVEYTKDFYDLLEQVEKLDYGQEYKDLVEEKNELLKRYRNSELEVNETLIPQVVKDRILAVEQRMSDIRDTVKLKSKSKIKFSDVAKIVETDEYKKAVAAHKGNKAWHNANHTVNAKGYSKPLSYWTKLVPVNTKHIIRSNKRYWAETDKNSVWYNQNFDDTWKGQQPTKKWKNNQYDKLTVQEKEILAELIRVKNDGDNLYQVSNKNYYLLPQISKTGLDVLTEENRLSNMKELIEEAFVDKVSDDIHGEIETRADGSQVKYIPKRYIQKLDNPDFISDDLVSSVIKYRAAAEKYKQMSDVAPNLQLVLNAIEERRFVGKTKSLAGAETTVFKAVKGFVDHHVHGIGTEPIGYLNIAGKQINMSKVLTKLNNYVRSKNLVMNLFTTLTAYSTASINSKIEDLVGSFTDQKSKLFAEKEYLKNVHEMLLESGTAVKHNKLSLVLERLGILQDDPFANLDKNRLLRLGTELPFASYEIVGHRVKSKAALAMMNHFRISDGKLVTEKQYGAGFDKLPNLYSMFEVQGNKIVTTIPNDLLVELQLKVEFIANRIDGMISVTDKSAAHRHAIMQLVTTHRNWLFSGLQNRLKSKGKNYITNEYEEGYYRSYWNFLKGTFMRPDRLRLLKNMIAQWDNLEEYEKLGVKRTLYEIAMAVAVGVVAVMLNAAADDGDDEDYLLQLSAYIANRTLLETSVFPSGVVYPPIAGIELASILNSPVAATSTLDNLVDIIYLFDTDEIERGTFEGMTRGQKALIKLSPGLRGYFTSRSPRAANTYLKYKSLKWLY